MTPKLSKYLTLFALVTTLTVGLMSRDFGVAPVQAADDAETIPAEKDALFAYLQNKTYEKLAAKETKPHPSAGPHTSVGLPVRVFMNAVLDQSMAAENESHPKGSAVVKEMFSKDGALRGWAVAVKTDDNSGDGGEGWYWYEVTSTTDGSNPVAAGKGVGLCAGCHVAGTDFVLSEYPLQ